MIPKSFKIKLHVVHKNNKFGRNKDTSISKIYNFLKDRDKATEYK